MSFSYELELAIELLKRRVYEGMSEFNRNLVKRVIHIFRYRNLEFRKFEFFVLNFEHIFYFQSF